MAARRRTPAFLVLLYDDGCPLCRTLRGVIASRRPLVPIHLVGAGSAQARAMFPDLDPVRCRDVLTVVDDCGQVYEADGAWLMCAWALPGLHGVAGSLSGPGGRRALRGWSAMMNRVRRLGRSSYPLLDGDAEGTHTSDDDTTSVDTAHHGDDRDDAPGATATHCPVGFPVDGCGLPDHSAGRRPGRRAH